MFRDKKHENSSNCIPDINPVVEKWNKIKKIEKRDTKTNREWVQKFRLNNKGRYQPI